MIQQSLFTSKKQDYETPQYLFDLLNSIMNFDLDMAADSENKKCEKYFSLENNAMDQDYSNYYNVYCNPPYNNQRIFIEKAFENTKKYCWQSYCFLIPARTDTKLFHDLIYNRLEVKYIFIKGRLKFGNSKNSAPFPSMLVFINIPFSRYWLISRELEKNGLL